MLIKNQNAFKTNPGHEVTGVCLDGSQRGGWARQTKSRCW